MADNNQYDDVPWYTSATNWISQKAKKSLDYNFNVFNKILPALAPQMLGPVGAAVQGVQLIQKNTGSALTNGVKLQNTVLDKLFNPKVLDSDLGDLGGAIVKGGAIVASVSGNAAKSIFNDDQKSSDDNSSSFKLPFWAKTAIVASVVIGTVLIIKGSFNES